MLVLTISMCLVGIYMMYRNHKVYQFRMQILRQVSDAAQSDGKTGRPWRWRYDEMSAVSYNEMMYQFWKPLRVESFYERDDFIRE